LGEGVCVVYPGVANYFTVVVLVAVDIVVAYLNE